MRRSAVLALWVVLGSAGCARNRSSSSAAPPASASAGRGTLALGERVTTPLVSLADIARSPTRFANQVVATTGKVTAVCQAMGCWMEIGDEASRAHVRMHGHSFFVPKTAAGHVARVQGTVVARPGEDCEDSPAPDPSIAKVELDATGVELD